MSPTDTTPAQTLTTSPTPHPTHLETTMSHLTHTTPRHLITLTALLTLVLTIALPALEVLISPTTSTSSPTHTTHTTPTQTPSPRISKADKAAAHHDGCRQTSSSADLLARPSCRSGMPITHDRGIAQAPPQAPDSAHPGAHGSTHPAPMNEVPPAWADHWGAAAHSPHHRSQA